MGRGPLSNQRSLDDGSRAGLEEERRLAYVGLTRPERAKIYHAPTAGCAACGEARFRLDSSGTAPDHAEFRDRGRLGLCVLWR
jgi:superfamily I DNA/RNA helicase